MTGYNGRYDRHDPAKVAAIKARCEEVERGKITDRGEITQIIVDDLVQRHLELHQPRWRKLIHRIRGKQH